MKSLLYLDLRYCILVEKLPEELGRLECLKELDIEGAGISRLPQSIFQLKNLCIFGSRWRLESEALINIVEAIDEVHVISPSSFPQLHQVLFKQSMDEEKFIQKIVMDISLKLSSINWGVEGMETRVKNVVSSLEIGFEDVRMIGIKGIGGGGKTTLARAVFDHVSDWFEGVSFIENVREVSKSSSSGLRELQKQILQDVLIDQSIKVESVFDGKNKIKKRMCSRKVFVVLDDVDNIDQLEALAGELTWFKPGSRIIITTKDEQVLIAHKVNFVHDVNQLLLSDEEATCLFSRYAFAADIPIQGFEELSEKVVHYAAGLPLTIKVLGSHLCGRSEDEWVDALERLKTIPLKETLEKLELSYNGLENDHKEIFLDVVCLLKGMEKNKAIRILESCGFHAQIGLRVLEKKTLITISNGYSLRFHDSIEEMGRNIARRLHHSNHRRLWIEEEIECVLGTEATRSIKLDYAGELYPEVIMKGLRNMKELMFLYVNNFYGEWEDDEAIQYLPDSLRFLYWSGYPLPSLPKTFQANKLVTLEMEGSSISQLWDGGERKVLDELWYLDLSRPDFRTLDLGMTPNLEELDLEECKNFEELQLPVECSKLKYLNLTDSMVSNLNLGMFPHLEKLKLLDCNDFVELQLTVKCPNLIFLNLSGSKLRTFNIGMTPNLEKLDLSECHDFVELHLPVECPKLKFLDLGSSRLSNLDLRMTPHLMTLKLESCDDLVELHLPSNLIFLYLLFSKLRTLDLRLTPNLENLDLSECDELVELHLPVKCPKLKFNDLSGSKLRTLNLGMTPNLAKLNLAQCNDLLELNLPGECPKLKFLNLRDSKVSSLNLGMTPNLKKLNLQGCKDFVELHFPIERSKEELGRLECLEELNINGAGITHLPQSIYQMEGLRIIGSRGQLESYGFTSLEKVRGSYYVEL
ncbi:hypothetical protein L1987_64658 [Smallanthus sonchifolius]|uniref:Uncharacterized protein n=1 Tax=Smallanthus sonchifolius TaxID=185202 RepID=A0ACB9BSD4_9ASTR|nr:hypothetical protein L1987_64658 [Smallanthus sonchifolius]